MDALQNIGYPFSTKPFAEKIKVHQTTDLAAIKD